MRTEMAKLEAAIAAAGKLTADAILHQEQQFVQKVDQAMNRIADVMERMESRDRQVQELRSQVQRLQAELEIEKAARRRLERHPQRDIGEESA